MAKNARFSVSVVKFCEVKGNTFQRFLGAQIGEESGGFVKLKNDGEMFPSLPRLEKDARVAAEIVPIAQLDRARIS